MYQIQRRRTRLTAASSVVGAATAVLFINGLPAHAQQTEIEALRAQNAELAARVGKLEDFINTFLETNKKAAATPPLTAKEKLSISGILQVNGRAFFNQQGPGTGPADTFQLRRGEFRISANITPRISGSIQLDPAKQLSATSTSTVVPPPAGSPEGTPPTVTTTTNINQSSNVLQEIVLTGLLHQSTKSPLYTDIGQYKIPIGYEGDLVSSGTLQNVERALFFQARDPFGGGNGDIRDTGVRLRGTAGQFDYQLGIFNGFGERQNALANSDNKPIIGRLIFKPASIPGLQLGISGGIGTTRNTPTAGSRADRQLLNLFSAYKKDKWTFQAEFLDGKNQLLAAAPGVVRDVQGYYAHVGYAFTPKIEGTLRYDFFDFDRNLVSAAGASGDTSVRDLILGINYYLKGHNAKIQANLVKRNGGTGLVSANGFGSNATGFGKDSTQVRTNFQIGF
ncbi:MAG: OprO/OprP family phosphate-selective porin [Armatimonadota bacterium]|nr:OprO/OprP family phosphate-selective porin [Armatimonadota bacterium]